MLLPAELGTAIGSCQPSNRRAPVLTMPNCGFSTTVHTNVAATTGATYGSSMQARTAPRPRNGRRSASAATSPSPIEPTVPPTE